MGCVNDITMSPTPILYIGNIALLGMINLPLNCSMDVFDQTYLKVP